MTIGWWIKKLFERFGMVLSLRKYDPDYTMLGFKNIDFDAVIDIGANRGDYIKRFRAAFPRAEIYAFEPIPEIFALLKKSFKDGRLHLYNFALADKAGVGKFNYDISAPASSSFLKASDYSRVLWRKDEGKTQEIEVNIATLDSKMLGKIQPGQKTLIKLDVEGYEKKVIEGGKKTFERATACVIEVHFSNWYEGQPTFDEIYQVMKTLGYEYRGNWYQAPMLNGAAGYIDALFIKSDFINSSDYHALEK